MARYLLIDVGGTFIKYALSDENAEFLEQGKVPTKRDSLEEFMEAMYSVCDLYKGKIDACALSMPGRIDTANGIAVTAGAMTLIMPQNYPIGQKLSEYLGCPVTVGNDGKCAAQAEAWKGALKDCANGLVIVFGTGIGGGIVIDHKVYLGSHFAAGELSEVLYDSPMLENGFDMSNIMNILTNPSPFWTSYSAASFLLADFARRKGQPFGTYTGEQVFESYRAGDEDAIATLQKFADQTACGIFNIQSIMDVETVAVGGGISGAPELLPLLQKSLDKVFDSLTFALPMVKPKLVKCRYGADANLIGALKLHHDRVK